MLGVGTVLAGDLFLGSTPMDNVFLGSAEIWRRAPSLLVTSIATGSGQIVLPDWVVVYDIIGIGGGTGGTGGGTNPTAPRGKGGKPGVWASVRVVRATAGPVTLTWNIGSGGAGGSGSFLSDDPGDPGSATTVNYPGGTLTCPGGSGEHSDGNGGPAGNHAFNGFVYTGGGSAPQPGANNAGPDGYSPGGGGAGGYWKKGGNGAPGGLFIRAASIAW